MGLGWQRRASQGCFDGQTATATADEDRRWIVTHKPIKGNTQGRTLVIGAKTIDDVLVAEVWLCSEQSNMQMSLAASLNSAERTVAANYPAIRQSDAPRKRAFLPQLARLLDKDRELSRRSTTTASIRRGRLTPRRSSRTALHCRFGRGQCFALSRNACRKRLCYRNSALRNRNSSALLLDSFGFVSFL